MALSIPISIVQRRHIGSHNAECMEPEPRKTKRYDDDDDDDDAFLEEGAEGAGNKYYLFQPTYLSLSFLPPKEASG